MPIRSSRSGIALALTLVFVCAALPLDLFSLIIPALSVRPGFTSEGVSLYVQLYLMGYSVGQLVWGIVSDFLGRRRVLLMALGGIFILNTLFLWVPLHEGRAVLRFGSGVFASAGLCLPRAIFRDLAQGKEMAIFSSRVTMFSECFMTLSPVIVGFLVCRHGAEAQFVVVSILVFMTAVATYVYLPETLKTKKNFAFWPFITSLGAIMREPKFLFFTLLAGFSYFVLMFYLSNGGRVWENHFGLLIADWTPFHSVILSGLIWGSLINAIILRYTSVLVMIYAGLFLSALMIVLVSLFGLESTYMFTGIMLILMTSIGTLFANCLAKAMEPFAHEAGVGSSLYGAVQVFTASLLMYVGDFCVRAVPFLAH